MMKKYSIKYIYFQGSYARPRPLRQDHNESGREWTRLQASARRATRATHQGQQHVAGTELGRGHFGQKRRSGYLGRGARRYIGTQNGHILPAHQPNVRAAHREAQAF